MVVIVLDKGGKSACMISFIAGWMLYGLNWCKKGCEGASCI